MFVKELFNNFKHYVETLNKDINLYSNNTTMYVQMNTTNLQNSFIH